MTHHFRRYAPIGLLLMIFAGLTATRLLVSQDQDIRQQAFQLRENATLALATSSDPLAASRQSRVDITVNTYEHLVDAIEISAELTANLATGDTFDNVTLSPTTPSGLTLTEQELDRVSANRYKLTLKYTALQPFTTENKQLTLASIYFFQQQGTTVTFSYNQSLTKITQKITGANVVSLPKSQELIFASIASESASLAQAIAANTDPTIACQEVGAISQLHAYPLDPESILLEWDRAVSATNYSILYGVNPGSFLAGVPKLGNITTFVLNHLDPDTTYHIAIFGNNTCNTTSRILTSISTPTATASAKGGTSFLPFTTKFGTQVNPETITKIPNIDTYQSLEALESPLPDVASSQAVIRDFSDIKQESFTDQIASWLKPGWRLYGVVGITAVLILMMVLSITKLLGKKPVNTGFAYPEVPFELTGGQPLPDKQFQSPPTDQLVLDTPAPRPYANIETNPIIPPEKGPETTPTAPTPPPVTPVQASNPQPISSDLPNHHTNAHYRAIPGSQKPDNYLPQQNQES